MSPSTLHHTFKEVTSISPLQYLKQNQPTPASSLPPAAGEGERVGALAHLNHLWTYSLGDYMTLDAATRRNLELTVSLQPAPDSSCAK